MSTLWIVYVLNSAYGDITTLYNHVYIDHVSPIHYTPAFVLFGALLVEPAIIMVLLARILNPSANRRANMLVGGILTAINVGTLFVGTPTLAYAFLTSAMIAIGVAIVWCAWKWVEPATPQTDPASGRGVPASGAPTRAPA
ncbi:MAG: DUF6326 family protein [Thermoplasmata archaeon]|nr:DUF6326 family protein [Thermoplasmata archaeon]